MKRTVSDRKGNLVVLRLRQDDFTAAFTLLEQLLLADSQDNYVMGCIIKQGILGHYYLKQRELKSAERVFSSALEFIRSKDAALFNESWNLKEAQVAEQVQGR
jgi:Tfp pilus assembly protein PilF